MSCEHCASAQKDADWAGYQARCRGCQVRALANGPAFHESMGLRRITAGYRKALEAAAGKDWEQLHRQVRNEYERLQGLRYGVIDDVR